MIFSGLRGSWKVAAVEDLGSGDNRKTMLQGLRESRVDKWRLRR